MLDFDQLDRALEIAVGVAPLALLAESAPNLASRFAIARERLSELSEVASPRQPVILERDRLASFFGCAYGDHGFLARAGTLHTLELRLRHIASAIPALTHEPGGLGALRREAAILRALADHRLSRPRLAEDAPLVGLLDSLESALAQLADFSLAAGQGSRSLQVAEGAGRLYGLADLTNVASDFRDGLSLPGILSFILGRLADRGFTHESRSLLDELCESHVALVREQLWSAAMEAFALRPHPPSLRELRELDLSLEALRVELTTPRRAAHLRTEALATTFALLALARAEAARRACEKLLPGAIQLITDGLAAEGA